MKNTVTVLSENQYGLTEGPQWDEQTNRLYFIDATYNTINYWDANIDTMHKIEAKEMVSALAFTHDGVCIGATPHGLQEVDLSTGELKPIIDPEYGIDDNRFNDGKVGPDGNFWAGTISAKRTPTAALYCFYDRDEYELKVSGVHNSNGLGWSPDGKVFYHIDTTLLQVFAYDFDAQTAVISKQRIVIDFNDKNIGKPDGLCVDSRGYLWIGHWAGGQVSCWNPQTHEMIQSIALPAKNVTSCTFGGTDLKTLFITTAQDNETDQDGGKIYTIDLDIAGLKMNRLSNKW